MNTQSPPPDPMSESAIAGSAEKLRQEFERWIEAVMQRGEQTLDRLGLRSGRPWQPAVEVVETADDVQVFVDVPGVHPQDIDVKLVGQTLTISGNRGPTVVAPSSTLRLNERPRGVFERSIPMPAPVNVEQVNAEVKEGVLSIRLAKSEVAKARKIPVTSVPSGAVATPVETDVSDAGPVI